MRRGDLHIAALWAWIFTLLTLAACGTQSGTPSMPEDGALPLGTPMATSQQAAAGVALTQEKNKADERAAATAEIERANAQEALNSANATLSAVQTQDQSDVNVVAAQMASTAEIGRANAEATLNSAGSTQAVALTQDVIRQTQIVEAMVNLQNENELAASTQTAVANHIATQTQAALASTELHADQLAEERRGPITFLWTWCLPIFIVLFAGLALWGFWRWLKIQQSNQRILETPVQKLRTPAATVPHHHHDSSFPPTENEVVNGSHQFTKPDDEMRRWLETVRRKLLGGDTKDENDSTGN